MGSLGSLEAGKYWGTRAKGDFPFEISPLCFFRFFEDLIRYQIAAGCHSGSVRFLRAELKLPLLFRYSSRCKSFPGFMPKHSVSRVLRESRCRFSRSSVAGSPDGLFCSLLLGDFSSV